MGPKDEIMESLSMSGQFVCKLCGKLMQCSNDTYTERNGVGANAYKCSNHIVQYEIYCQIDHQTIESEYLTVGSLRIIIMREEPALLCEYTEDINKINQKICEFPNEEAHRITISQWAEKLRMYRAF